MHSCNCHCKPLLLLLATLFATGAAKGRTNIELREQFILADGVSQSMAAFTPRRSTPNAAATASSSPNAQNGSSNLPPYMSGQGPIIKVNLIEKRKRNRNQNSPKKKKKTKPKDHEFTNPYKSKKVLIGKDSVR